MRWLITGAQGMLGQDFLTTLLERDHDVLGIDIAELDITNGPDVLRFVAESDAEVVVNCAAYTAVDAAETNEALAHAVNADGAGNLARAAAAANARIVQISTDYVFDGTATTPYAEGTPGAPVSAYGRTKWAGEQAVRSEHPAGHLVVRTAWLYGAGGPCFPKTMARLADEHETLTVVDDQIGQPTWTMDVVRVVIDLVEAAAASGTYHATASGQASWFGFTRAILSSTGLDPARVRPTDSSAFVRPAPRPAYSVLGHDALARVGVAEIPDWAGRWAVASGAVLSGL